MLNELLGSEYIEAYLIVTKEGIKYLVLWTSDLFHRVALKLKLCLHGYKSKAKSTQSIQLEACGTISNNEGIELMTECQ